MLLTLLLCACCISISSQIEFDPTLLQIWFFKSLLSDCDGVKDLFNLNYNKIISANLQPNLSKTQLYLFNGTKKTPYAMTNVKGLIKDPGFSLMLPTVIVLHGWNNVKGVEDKAARKMINGLLARGRINVLAMDYAQLLDGFYVKAVTYAKFVGEELGRTVMNMKTSGVKHVHLLGHSLGAQVAGFAGKYYYKTRGSKIDRITGLSVAGPCFFDESSDWRLSEDDADFVDTIHTDYSVLGASNLGLGHANFYPNNPFALQPGCTPEEFCSHSRSVDIYVESLVKPKTFLSVSCPNWLIFNLGLCDGSPKAYMGYGVSTSARGIYVLKTAATSPYGMKSKGIEPQWTPKNVFGNYLNIM